MEPIDILTLLLAGVLSWIGAGLAVLIWHMYAVLYLYGADNFDRELVATIEGENTVFLLLWPIVLGTLTFDLWVLYRLGELREYQEPDLSEVG